MDNQNITENDPELSGKYLGTITSDFVNVSDNLKEAPYLIRKQEFSKYPIFVISKTDLPVWSLLYDQKEFGLQWNYYASYLEDFIERKIVEKNKKDDFIAAYKDPDEYCCLFVVDKEFTKFIFIPYPID